MLFEIESKNREIDCEALKRHTRNVHRFQDPLLAMESLDSPISHIIVRFVCRHRVAVPDNQYRQRWFHQKGSADIDRRIVCVNDLSDMHLAHHPAHYSLHQADSAEAHHTHIVDGADLRFECGSYCFLFDSVSASSVCNGFFFIYQQWFGLIYPEHSFYLNSVRECYEAYVIYNFMVYLLNFLNLEMDLEASIRQKAPVKHVFPLCCLTPWRMDREFVHNCKHGILQYTVFRPLTTFISV